MNRWLKIIMSVPAIGVIICVRFYQRMISPMLPATCRFTPTCSAYAIAAIRKHGFVIGSAKSIWRILRCHPFCEGGHDPP